ncbi:MAG: hypothetical protein R3301_02070 [Saprospiraceae bacterium]|nr:hypothetical protein [Saprospiraceae bacterium]
MMFEDAWYLHMIKTINPFLTIAAVNMALNSASKKKKIGMASKWETRERKTRRMAIILSVVLHVVVITALSVSSNSEGDNGLKHLIEAVFGNQDERGSTTADLEQS